VLQRRKALVLLLIAGCCVAAEPGQSLKVAAGVAGHPWGASIEEVLTDGRRPIGFLRSDERTTLILYDDSSALRFIDHRLAGVEYGSTTARFIRDELDHGRSVAGFASEDGLRSRMTYDQVRSLLGSAIPAKPDFRATATAGAASILLEFIGVDGVILLAGVRVSANPAAPPQAVGVEATDNGF
jgi:hypothetical protein